MIKTLVLVLALATPAVAQTVTSVINLDDLGWGPLETPRPIDTDGSPFTTEWLVQSIATRAFRVVALRNGSVCAGDWFSPRDLAFGHPFTSSTVQRLGMTDHMLITSVGNPRVVVVRLNTPDCDGH